MLRRLPVRATRLLLVVALAIGLVPASAAAAAGDVDQVVSLTFPVDDPRGLTGYTNDYYGERSRGDHGATDIGGAKAYGVPVHAAVGGRVTHITGLDGSLPSYGWMITISGTDGRSYGYVHLGRQDGPASEAYAPGIRKGTVVERGQHIGYVGHSGNASASWPHLHFTIDDPNVTDRQGTNRINPYYSLQDAERRGDRPGSVVRVSKTGFEDVAYGHAHEEGIGWVKDNGVTSGCATKHYCPERGVTRGQMATFLQRALELPDGGAHGFEDVPARHAHARGIAAVASAGIANGKSSGRFEPEAVVRRDQMATFLRNALDLPGSTPSYRDVPRSSPHAQAIGAIGEARITTGYRDGSYRPELTVSRAQMATFLQRAFEDR